MIIKTVEIRDRATLIPALAIQFNGLDGWLIRRAGYDSNAKYLALIKLVDLKAELWPEGWGDRTMTTAHKYLKEQPLELLDDGVMVDVEFILGETTKRKESEWIKEYCE